jgi:hypothetical protein
LTVEAQSVSDTHSDGQRIVLSAYLSDADIGMIDAVH